MAISSKELLQKLKHFATDLSESGDQIGVYFSNELLSTTNTTLDLRGRVFYRCVLFDYGFEQDGCLFFDCIKYVDGLDYTLKDVCEVVKRRLEYSDLYGANLHSAKLNYANLKGANLQYVNFENANLYGADMREACLRDANLQSASLKGANLRYANLDNAKLFVADLKSIDLKVANLKDADLRKACLNFADIQDADLQDANLEGADLQGANLIGANLSGANLIGANLKDALYNSETTGLSSEHTAVMYNYDEEVYEGDDFDDDEED